MTVDLSIALAQTGHIFGALDPQQGVGEHVLIQADANPARQVQQRDEAHEVVGVVGVVPGAGSELPEDQAPGELPGVDKADVEGEPPPRAPASPEVQVEVELLHQEAAAAVHQEGPQGRVATQGPVRLLHQVKNRGEDHLIQKAVHPKEQETHKAWQTLKGIMTSVHQAGFACRVWGAGGVKPQL